MKIEETITNKEHSELTSHYLPKILENNEIDNREFSIIKKQNNEFTEVLNLDNLVGNLNSTKKTLELLNNIKSNDVKYFIVNKNFAIDILKFSPEEQNIINNKTQKIINILLMDNKLNIDNILKPIEIVDRKTSPILTQNPPKPSEIKNNYIKLEEQFNFYKNKQIQAEKKYSIQKKLVITTLGLLGTGVLVMPLAAITFPAALVVGSIAVIKLKFFNSNLKENKESHQWNKRIDLLKEAATNTMNLNSFDAKKVTIKDISDMVFTPEILKNYKELSKKCKLTPMVLKNTYDIHNNIDNIRNKYNSGGKKIKIK